MNFLQQCLAQFCQWSDFFPCPGCRGRHSGAGRNAFCPECRERLQLLTPHHRCPGCGAETDGVLALCSACMREEKRPWRDAVTLFEYRDFGKEIIRDFKFHGRVELARPLGELGGAAVRRTNWQLDLIVPIPLHWLRRWSRGYNQAGVIAERLGQELNLPVSCALTRPHYGKRQASLKRAERQKNPKKLFKAAKPELIAGKSLLLVDDIFTTGATLTAASQVLLAAGAREIRVFTLARTHHYNHN